MADEKDLAEKVEESQSAVLEKTLDLISQEVVKNENLAKTNLAKVEAKLEGKLREMDAKIEKGFEIQHDQFEQLAKRTSFVGRFEQDDLSGIKEKLSEGRKNSLDSLDQMQFGGVKDARQKAFVADWFAGASKLMCVRSFGREHDQILRWWRPLDEALHAVGKTALAGLTDASGGYTIPNIVAGEVLKIIRDASLIYGRARQVVMTSDTLIFPNEATAVTINWSNTDGTTLTPGEPVFGSSTLNARKLIGRATFSLELLDDSNVAILPFLQACFAEKMGGELDLQAIEGSGSPFTGVSGATSVNDAGGTNGTNGVVLTYSSTASTKASLVKIYTAASETQPRNEGFWVCGPAVYAQIIGMVDSNGQPVVRFGNVEGAPSGTILGRPIIVSARLPKTTVGAGTVSVGGLYFGPGSALLFGTRRGMQWDVTDQVSWATYQGDARMVGRFGYVVGVPTAWVKQLGIIV